MRGINAYRAAENSPAGLMEVERDALLRAARALEASKTGTARDKIEALHWNNQLWAALAFDCASDANRLSEQLRANIISLAIWATGHSEKVLIEGADVNPLVEVNRTVAAGVSAAIKNYYSGVADAIGSGEPRPSADVVG